ncbi:hypothetical protein [Nocardia huaxiensis]|uniref:Uncharacterized protein n=1 Tax=Nocardia huaxiensis TaxID=2755382 RepID=A0A7D6ZHY6_9NOCA|nr:hypothetical protein [Nocardia huaxiensis]QLY30180.1 hypothetical protein H0264_34295 [Nocardia huaxiensis]UFS96205.1 hypothetical protein LPY97_37155 [Nocardia huaxiensis]
MSITLSAENMTVVRTAAYGAVSLVAAADVKSHRAAAAGTVALTSATGLVGHVLAAKSKDIKLTGKSVAELADQVFPALADAVALLEQTDPAEAGNFRNTVLFAIAAATGSNPTPVAAEMARKITAAMGIA